MSINRILAFLAACSLVAVAQSGVAAEHQPTAKSSQKTTAGQDSVPTGRLPKDVKPTAYTIDFTMNPDKASYHAHEEIRIKLSKPRHVIWLHGRGIDVSNAKLMLKNGKSLNIDYKQVNKDGVVKLSLPKTVQPQQARLVFKFKNKYSPGLMGAYKVKDGGNSYIFTQFEAIGARKAFPSFDEPAFKTPFSYSFTVPKGDKVVANTTVKKKTKAGNGMVKWQFMKTKPLPTYLIAWAVGPLDIVKGPPIKPDSVRKRPVPLYGVTVKGKGNQIHYALQHAGEIVRTEEKYYKIGYPWRKLSLIAVPDFAAGAMENAGAITFRDGLLLMNPKTAPTSQKRAYWADAAHELGHMWTGDLVTVPWWNDIWLNEAFATWMEQKVMDKLHPEWHPKMDEIESKQAAMHADSLVSARAVRQPIKNTGDIENAFDAITYLKGSALIRMFENYVGPEKFRQGMHNYLEENKYGSANLDDFLTAISKASGHHVASSFKTFLNQPGLPLVQVTLKTSNGKPIVHLAQSRYLPLGSTGNPKGEKWQIPVCMRYAVKGKASQQCTMLSKTNADVPLKAKSKPAWFMPNAKGIGYYQWSLDKTGYRELTKSRDRLTPTGQLSLAGSIEAAFHAGKIDTAEAMQALAPLAHSQHGPVAEEPMGLIAFAHERLLSGKAKHNAEAFARKLYSHYNVAKDFKKGGAPKKADRRQFEAHVASFLTDTGKDRKVRKAADQAAKRLVGLNDSHAGKGKPDFNAVASDFVPVALMVGVRQTGQPVFDKLEQTFRHASTPFVRNVTLHAMASATTPKLAKRVRAMMLKPGLLRENEIPTILFTQFGQPETREATWQWLKSNYHQLIKELPSDFFLRLPMVGRFFCSDKKAADVKAFFKGHTEAQPGSKRVLTQALEAAHLCAAERKAQSASAKKFFSTSAGNGNAGRTE
jgi:alanyl aminopeptidase